MAKMHVSSNYISAKLTAPEQALIEAVSPRVDVERKDNRYHVTITDIDGEHEFDLLNGERGLPGLNGLNGKDGETPLVMAVKKGSTTTVTLSTSKYEESFDVEDGKAGAPGQNGISPQATVTKTGNITTIKITDLNGVTMATVNDGAPGQPGADGVSPNVTVTDITGGHRVTITDATGTHSFDVMDGAKGDKGNKGDDYTLTAADKQEIAGLVDAPVTDVQVNGVSVLSEGVANVPVGKNVIGAVMVGPEAYGLTIVSNPTREDYGTIKTYPAEDGDIKSGVRANRPIDPAHQHKSAFYGLAKASGDTTQSQSSNTVGQYTESAKSAISEMLGGAVEISGTTPTINALPGVRYVCGECATLDIIAPETGCIDVTFTSGSTPTVLTVTSARANTTIKWANGFDPSALDADTVYEINILDGELGVAGAWT